MEGLIAELLVVSALLGAGEEGIVGVGLGVLAVDALVELEAVVGAVLDEALVLILGELGDEGIILDLMRSARSLSRRR